MARKSQSLCLRYANVSLEECEEVRAGSLVLFMFVFSVERYTIHWAFATFACWR
jgi:hypothetical protein